MGPTRDLQCPTSFYRHVMRCQGQPPLVTFGALGLRCAALVPMMHHCMHALVPMMHHCMHAKLHAAVWCLQIPCRINAERLHRSSEGGGSDRPRGAERWGPTEPMSARSNAIPRRRFFAWLSIVPSHNALRQRDRPSINSPEGLVELTRTPPKYAPLC